MGHGGGHILSTIQPLVLDNAQEHFRFLAPLRCGFRKPLESLRDIHRLPLATGKADAAQIQLGTQQPTLGSLAKPLLSPRKIRFGVLHIRLEQRLSLVIHGLGAGRLVSIIFLAGCAQQERQQK